MSEPTTVLARMVDAACERMERQRCECLAILEPHTKGDCGPMWHRVTWHGQTVYGGVATVAEARAYFPPCPCLNEED